MVIEDTTGNLTDGWDGESGQGQGGAISLELASATIEGNVFRRNQSLQGGAIFAQYSNATIRGNLFYANTDSVQYAENGLRGRGGALYFYESTGFVEGNTLVGNTALVDGAAIYMTVSAIEFRNNFRVAGNRSDGGGVTTADIAPLAWECNDVWSSGASEYAGWPDPTGTDGNVSADPLFCDASSGDFSIDASSPCAPAQSDGCGLIGAYGIGCGVTSVPEGGGLTGAVAAYPNPAVDHLWLRLASGAAGDIDVFDASGRRVRSLHWSGDGDGTSSSGTGSAGSLFWDLRGDGGALLPAGVYWARPRKAAGSAERFVIAPR
ncbi:MAG: right-handed parallel beta-helix repeat-containing protein [Candidatus Eisenbacteria bacterium]